MMITLDTSGIVIDASSINFYIQNGVSTMDADGNTKVLLGGWELVRSIRRYYLTACDWTQMPDAPLSDNSKALWQAYRQALRDIPQVYADYRDVRFPTIPTEA